MKKIVIQKFGDSHEMNLEDGEIPSPLPTQAVVKVVAAGINFIDIYQRQGLPGYNITPPYTPGLEGSGVIEAVGSLVTEFKVGERVAWVSVLGSYSQYQIVDTDKLVAIPAGIEFKTATAAMLQGITAHYLSHSTFPIKSGDVALIHAAAGGTGRLLAQMVINQGGRVIATTSSEEKSQHIKAVGAVDVIRYDRDDFCAEVLNLTDGKGVDVVYDGVGLKTFDKSLKCLKARSMMVLYGAASGAVPAFELQRLNSSGSLFITRPTIAHHIATKEELRNRSASVFDMIEQKKLKICVDATYPLIDAAQAHDKLESGASSGKLILQP